MSKFTFAFLYTVFFILSFSYTGSVSSVENKTAQPSEIEQIDMEIDRLESKLKDLRKDAFNKEMNAQPYMFDNWSEYTEEINANENDEKQIPALKLKIEELKSRKLKAKSPQK